MIDTTRRQLPSTVSLLALLALSACGGADSGESTPDVSTMSEAEIVELARGIHERVITLDTHDDINVANFTADQNYTMDLNTQVTLPKMEEGGLDVAWLIVYTGQRELDQAGFDNAYEQAVAKFDAIHRLTEEIAPDRIGSRSPPTTCAASMPKGARSR